MEILDKSQYNEYEEFVKNHPHGTITQSVAWHAVKGNWGNEIIVVRDDSGKIVAGMSVLIRRVPFGYSMLYSPRGPICDYNNKEQLEQLKKGIDLLAKKHRAYTFKMDPNVLFSNEVFQKSTLDMGFKQELGKGGFETIQARFNYRLYLDDRDQEALLMNFHHKTRYNIRVATRRGVEVKVVGADKLDEFMELMTTTGKRDGFTVRAKSYFENMLSALGDYARLYIAYFEGKAIAGAITTNYAGETAYIYGASDDEHRREMAPYLIQWEMICWAEETGCRVYDFQGVSGNFEDKDDPLYGLFRFKDGFTGQVDELAGEFDYCYKPFVAKLVDKGIEVNEWLKSSKRKRNS